MKKIIILACVIYTFCSSIASAQHFDHVGFTYSGTVGLLPILVAGTTNVGSNKTTIVNSQIITEAPVYRYKKTNAFAASVQIHLGLNIPFYRDDLWSVGMKLNGGVGLQQSIRDAEGLSSLIFDFPQFIYYRRQTNSIDHSFLLGYKYTMAAMPYQLVLAGYEFRTNDKTSVRFYVSPYRYRYYMMYTNGDVKPMLKIGEMGFSYIHNF